MFFSTHKALAFMAALQATLAATTPKYCDRSMTAEYNNIPGSEVASVQLPTPYQGLNYTGWEAVANANVGGIQGSVVRVHSPPGSIYIGPKVGRPSTEGTISVAPGGNHATFNSVYMSCLTAPAGVVGGGGTTGGANVPLPCKVKVTGTKTTGEKVTQDLEFAPALEQKLFILVGFEKIRSLLVQLLATEPTSGATNVNWDDLHYMINGNC